MNSRNRTFTIRALLLIASLVGLVGHASAVVVTRSFSASWFDPTHSGHGFSVEVVDNASGKNMVLYWYTFDANGAPLWVLAQGPVSGNRASLQAFTTTGARFGNDFNAGQVQTRNWGTMEVEFSDCNHGTVHWSPIDTALPAGSMPISRLTQLFGSACTGGISDDSSATSNSSVSELFLTNTGLVAQARARTRFQQLSDRVEFNVELEDLPAGAYTLRVGGQTRATINVAAGIGGTQGEVEFRSPVEPGKILLDFDPRGQAIEIAQGASVFFRSTLGNGSTITPPATGNAPPTGNAVYALRVEPQGNNGPELYAELEQRSDRVEFKVELEDLAAGTYSIRVGGTVRGELNVVAVTGGTNGEIEFRNPVESGKVLLNFDPRGALIEAVRNGVVAISGTLPNQPTGAASSDDGTGSPSTSLLSANLVSSGADSDANGNASYSQDGSEREFEVEIEDLADGDYTLTVGGVQRATIAVSRERGEVKFNNPARAGRELLNFDPRGQRIEIKRGGVLYLSVNFPS